MDEQIIEMLRDRFDQVDTRLDTLSTTIQTHCDKDETYWKKMDTVEAQVSVVKWLMGTTGGSALVAWLYSHFGRH